MASVTSALCAVAWGHSRVASDFDMIWPGYCGSLINHHCKDPIADLSKAHIISCWPCSLSTVTPNSTCQEEGSVDAELPG